MSLSSDFIDEARAASLADVIARCGLALRREGRELVGPCPQCGGSDRFSVNPTKEVFNCRGCGGKGHGAIDLAMFADGLDFLAAVEMLTGARLAQDRRKPAHPPRPAAAPTRKPDDESYAREQSRKAAWLWSRRQPVTEETPPALYLRKRGYHGMIPATLGHLPENGDHPPAMIAAFGLVAESEPGILAVPAAVTQVHITRLTAAGDKADLDPVKLILGPGTGAPIVLAPPNDLLGLAIVEGIEDGVSVHAGTGLGVWAAGTANRMPPLAAAVPSYIEAVTIFAHPDEAGRRHARELAGALAHRLEVFVEGLDT